MITNYEIKIINNERVVVLYFDFKLEIGSFNKQQKKNLLSTVKDYLNQVKLSDNYQKILLMSSGILIATILYIGKDMKLVSGTSLNTQPGVMEKLEVPSNSFTNELVLPSISEEESIQKIEQDEVTNQKLTTEDENITQSDDNIETNSTSIDHPVSINKVSANVLETPKKEEEKVEQQKLIFSIKTELEKQESNLEVKEDKVMVTVYRSSGSVLQMELEEYIVGVVAAEMPASFSVEALKAQTVVARTYALKKIAKGEMLTDTVSTQAYIDIYGMKTKWGNDFDKYYNKIKKAVSATLGEYITYQGDYINAVYHSTSNGYTEDAMNVWKESYPYLKSVESTWDKNTSSYEKTITKDFNNLLEVTGLFDINNNGIQILSRNKSGRVEYVQVGDKTYTGIEFRNLLGLRSTDFDIEIINDNIKITTRGYGHGVGMSQYGANEMAKQGYNYEEIIKYYYTGVQIKKYE